MTPVVNAVSHHGEHAIAFTRVGSEALVHVLMALNERSAN
jgi:hypothetical protein